MHRSLLIILCLAICTALQAADPITIKPGPLTIEVNLNGRVVPVDAVEVSLSVEEWPTFVVTSAIPHGSQVKQGDMLVEFDSSKLEESIRKTRNALQKQKLELKRADAEIAHNKEVNKVKIQLAEQAVAIAKDNVDRFKAAVGPSQKRIKQLLRYAEEELSQLKKMYDEDSITEETEEIILIRQQDYVNTLRFLTGEIDIKREQKVEHELPQALTNLEQSLAKAKMEFRKLKMTLPAELKQLELERAKKALEVELAEAKLTAREKDRKLMRITAAEPGIVYYGAFRNGRWVYDDAKRQLRKGGTVRVHQVVMTIVNPQSIAIVASVDELDAGLLKAGQNAVAVPEITRYRKLDAKLTHIDTVPDTPDSFLASFDLIKVPKDITLLPGMTAKLRMTPYAKKDAITVPNLAVHEDPFDRAIHYVWLKNAAGNVVRHVVEPGYSTDDETEILEGLKAGDVIYKKLSDASTE